MASLSRLPFPVLQVAFVVRMNAVKYNPWSIKQLAIEKLPTISTHEN
jgi:hypothetical protein